MANLSGIVKKISDLVSGTPSDDDCFIFGKSDVKKITLAKLKDALGITSINSALTKSVITEQPESGNADRMTPQSNITKFYVISDSTGTLENNFPIAGAGLLISTNFYNIHYLQIFYPLSAKSIYLRGYRQNQSWSQWKAIS